jgi:hypothetical protein
MILKLKITNTVRKIEMVFDPPLTDDEFEALCFAEDFAEIERTKDGVVVYTLIR